MQPATVTTELGLEVPEAPGEGYRAHTAERWKERDPVSYGMCITMIRHGIVNQSELVRLVQENREERGLKNGVSRNCIKGLMLAEFNEAELLEISRKSAIIGRASGIEKTTQLIESANDPDQVGGVALATMQLHQISQVMSDKPTGITEERVVFRVEDFNAEVDEMNKQALPPPAARVEAKVIDVEAAECRMTNAE